LINAVVAYKLGRSTRRRFALRVSLWLIIFLSIAFTKVIYDFLFSNQLTQTEPLSLFDVMQITGIVLVFFIANQSYTKADILERRIQDLHQELSIRLSKNETSESDKKRGAP
jgi:hypothetical protein